tara:strand:- start:2673 stop:3374 length:702 start_codon:yes stop_codon:yes gene_type:complete
LKQVWDYLSPSIPSDHCRQMTAFGVMKEHVNAGYRAGSVLDFGCGNGRSADQFAELLPSAKWTGVDIEDSPEVASRVREDPRFVTYDGDNLPFDDRTFDLVYSYQVMEHVRNPETVLREIARVLVHDGLFIGQTSQFEPYHSYSLWNFTIYGFKRIMEDAGFRLLAFRPCIDGFTLMSRTYRDRPPHFESYFSNESPVNQEIELVEKSKSIQEINLRKLWFAGQFVFVASPLK